MHKNATLTTNFFQILFSSVKEYSTVGRIIYIVFVHNRIFDSRTHDLYHVNVYFIVQYIGNYLIFFASEN